MQVIEMFNEAFQMLIVPLMSLVVGWICVFLRSKTHIQETAVENELINNALYALETIVRQSVQSTNQTYVEKLKSENKFDGTAQKMAFDITYGSVMNGITDANKAILEKVTTDLPRFVTEMIESQVNQEKK